MIFVAAILACGKNGNNSNNNDFNCCFCCLMTENARLSSGYNKNDNCACDFPRVE